MALDDLRPHSQQPHPQMQRIQQYQQQAPADASPQGSYPAYSRTTTTTTMRDVHAGAGMGDAPLMTPNSQAARAMSRLSRIGADLNSLVKKLDTLDTSKGAAAARR